MVSAQQNGGASVIAFRGINVTPTTTDVTPTPTPTPTNEEAFNGRRHNDKYVSVSTGVLSYSIHIRFFSQNQSLLIPIENQNITKRVESIKLNNADDNSPVTTQVEVEEKDGYYKQDKDDDKHVYVSIVILPYCIQYTYNSSHKINLFFFSL